VTFNYDRYIMNYKGNNSKPSPNEAPNEASNEASNKLPNETTTGLLPVLQRRFAAEAFLPPEVT